MGFARLRTLRRNSSIRDLVAQTRLAADDLIMPYFVVEGRSRREPVKSMPGIYKLSADNLVKDIEEAWALGIKAVLLFGIPRKKDGDGKEAYDKDGVVQKAVRAIKKNIKSVAVITDVCLCGYTLHGHCGSVKNRKIDNDATIKILARIAVSHAEAGAGLVAPSAMMDGQVRSIRQALDRKAFGDVGILAYSAKYASNFYGPFREALGSAPRSGDRKSYQMDYRNSGEALREIAADIDEGADIVMVKPALAYLDIIYRAKENFNIPLAAFNVSGEYAMVRERESVIEVLTSIKRAGADFIITYHAKEAARWLRQ